MHLAKHPRLHVVEEMAVKGPAAWRIGGDEITEAFARFDVDRVLVGTMFAVPVLELTPQPMQMDRVLHHGVIDEYEPHPISALEFNGPGLGEFPAVEAPDEALHIAGEMQRDLVRRRPRIATRLGCPQIGVGEDAAA